jgi:hypothetical protein
VHNIQPEVPPENVVAMYEGLWSTGDKEGTLAARPLNFENFRLTLHVAEEDKPILPLVIGHAFAGVVTDVA